MSMILTEAQWMKVGSMIQGKHGIREIVIDKDLYGNAKVQVIGNDGVTVKNLQGNVIQFPIRNTPQNIKRVDLFNRFIAAAKNVGIEIGITLGVIEEFEEFEEDEDGEES